MIIPENSLDDFKRIIAGCQNFVITTHKNPDSDALGSTRALTKTLRHLGKNVTSVLSDDKHPFPLTHCLIYLDTPIADRAYIQTADFSRPPISISIDHHHQDQPLADLNLIVTDASATCEILLYIFEKVLNQTPDATIATDLLTGIIGDTRSFQHALFKSGALLAAARLMTLGGNLQKATADTFGNLSTDILHVFGKALSNINLKNKTAYSVLTGEDLSDLNLTNNNFDEIIALVNSVADSKLSLLLYQKKPDEISASLRSENFKQTDVRTLAKDFGGGGHPYAAGFKISGHLTRTSHGWMIKK